MKQWGIVLLALVTTSCSESKPAHYYVWCDNTDAQGWKLVDFEEDANGYILSCSYQSPDRSGFYTARCGASGCD
jgi:hypothetical protein